MHRSTLILIVGCALLSAAGCKQHTNGYSATGSAARTASTENVTDQLNSAVTNTCPEKHLGTIAPDALNTNAKTFYATLDVPERLEFDKEISRTCAQNASQPECYNSGFLKALNQDGKIPDFAKQVCGSAK